LEQISPTLINIAVIIFGLIIGSFLNVVVVRLPQGKSLVRPRSACPSCEKNIAWHDNIPVLSFLILRGRCRFCKTQISIRYPVIELLTALLFLAAKVRFGLSPLLIIRDWPFISILVAITFIDLEHRIIPDRLSLGGLALGLLTAWLVPGFGLIKGLLGAAAGFGVFFVFAWLYEKLSKKSGLGGGDIKLLAMLGAFVGPVGIFFIILISSVLGSFVGITWALASGKKGVMSVSIPYGPFLVVGALYYYLIGDLWLPSMIRI